MVEGIVERVENDEHDPKLGRLFVDIGAGAEDARHQGVVDFGLEPRYAKGTKPLADRFKPGDLVRVRLATERPQPDGGPAPLALELGPQAAMVVMDPATHEILALVGGYDYHAGGFDRSQRAHRQPGSAFKPFVYGAAIEARKITAASIMNDAPEVYELWKPQNYEKEEFRGPVRAAHGAGAVDQHRGDQGPVRGRTRRGARLRGPGGNHLAHRPRRRAVAGARLA